MAGGVVSRREAIEAIDIIKSLGILDEAGHVQDCGYDSHTECGCFDLPMRFLDALSQRDERIRAEALESAADDYTVNLTAMSGPRIRDWLRSR